MAYCIGIERVENVDGNRDSEKMVQAALCGATQTGPRAVDGPVKRCLHCSAPPLTLAEVTLRTYLLILTLAFGVQYDVP